MQKRSMSFTAMVAAMALSSCGQAPTSPPAATTTSATTAEPAATANTAHLAYIVSQHSPLLDAAARTAISQDFNGAPLSGPRAQHQVTAENVRCRSTNPPSGVPECSATYTASGQPVAIAGEDATALFAALAAAGIQDDAGMGHITRELTALQCTVDDAVAQDTPATGDQVAGFSCHFNSAP
jgi:hypothetical protein